jgi:hypothetical protein
LLKIVLFSINFGIDIYYLDAYLGLRKKQDLQRWYKMKTDLEETTIQVWLSDEGIGTIPHIWCGGKYISEISGKSYETTWATHESLQSGLDFSVRELARRALETVEEKSLPKQVRFVYGTLYSDSSSETWECLEKEGLKRYPAERSDFLIRKVSKAYKILEQEKLKKR